MVNTVAGRGTVNSPLEKVKAAIHQELLVLDICHESGNKRYLCSTFYLNLFFSLSSAQKVWVSKKINSNKIKSFFAFTYRTDEISNRVKSYIWQTAPGISNSHNIIFEKKKLIWRLHLTLYTLTSVCIFSILFSIHFLRCWEGEFV